MNFDPDPFYKKPAINFVTLIGALRELWSLLTGGACRLSEIRKHIRGTEHLLRKILTRMAEKHCGTSEKNPKSKSPKRSLAKSSWKKPSAPGRTDTFGLSPLRPLRQPAPKAERETRTSRAASEKPPRPKISEAEIRDQLLARLCRLEEALKNPAPYVEAFAKALKLKTRPLKFEDIFAHTPEQHAAMTARVMQQPSTGRIQLIDSS